MVAIGNDKARKVYEKVGYRDMYKRDYVEAVTADKESEETETETDKTTGETETEGQVEETAQVLSDACMSVMLTPGFDILLLDL